MNTRLLKTITTLALFMLSVSSAYAPLEAGEQERLADINTLLTAYRCIEKGKYLRGATVVTKVSLGGYSDDISQIEGMKNLLDTQEEFITAAFYSDIDVINEMKDVIRTELPPGKTGALRVASMWLKKCAEDRGNCEKFGAAIDLIKEKSAVSEQAIHDYYNRAIENEINSLATANSSAQLPKKTVYDEICTPIIAYYTLADNENEKSLVTAGVKLFNENRIKAEGFTATLIKLNENFASRIINKIHEKRSGKSR